MIGSWFLWMVAAYLISVSGDILVKKEYVWTGALLYASCTPFWVQVLRQKELVHIAVVSSIVGNALLLAGAYIFLGERLGPWQWVGFMLGMVAVMMMDAR